MSKKKIYTSLEGYKAKNRKTESYLELGDEFVEWINEKTVDLFAKRTASEILAGKELKIFTSDVQEQVYFRINGRSYFLDYFLPKYNLAIEIDGCYHRFRRFEDKQRDNDFSKIGIRTIRITSKEVLKGHFLESLKKKYYKTAGIYSQQACTKKDVQI